MYIVYVPGAILFYSVECVGILRRNINTSAYSLPVFNVMRTVRYVVSHRV